MLAGGADPFAARSIYAVHVAFALLTLFPGRVGGSESNVRGLLHAYGKGRGPDDVTVLANRHVMASYGELAVGPVRLHHVGSYRPGDSALTRALAMTSAAAVPRIAGRDIPSDIDVLHHPVTVPIPRIPGVPTVTTIHDLQHHEMPQLFSRPERAYRRWAYDGAARSADLVITSSEYSRSRVVEFARVPPERVAAIHLGIDHDRFTPGPASADGTVRERLGLPRRYILYPANLWPHKNHERLIDGFARARTDAHLVLSGQTYGRLDDLQRRARAAGIANRIHHLGYVDRDDVAAIYRAATAMVFPSMYEGFGAPPVEAMACGCPVASSTRTSLAEVVGDAALEFDPESIDEIASAIECIAEDQTLRDRLRSAGLANAARFDWSESAREHVAVYERALAVCGEKR